MICWKTKQSQKKCGVIYRRFHAFSELNGDLCSTIEKKPLRKSIGQQVIYKLFGITGNPPKAFTRLTVFRAENLKVSGTSAIRGNTSNNGLLSNADKPEIVVPNNFEGGAFCCAFLWLANIKAWLYKLNYIGLAL